MQTWEELLETGNGAVEYRLEIEGFRYNFVTDQSLVMQSESFVRLPGLTRAGMTIRYSTQMVERRLKAGGMTFNIVDNLAPLSAFDEASGSLGNESHGITEAFTLQFRKRTVLNDDLSRTNAVIDVESVEGFNPGDVIHIGTEAIQIGTVFAGGNQFLNCTRGFMNTIAQEHRITAEDGVFDQVWVTDEPLGLERRRCYLYAYGDGDNPSGPGTLIWRGILTNEKELIDGTTWRLAAAHVSELLREKIGGGFGEGSIRGVYHPTGFGFSLLVLLLDTSSIYDPTATDWFTVTIEGFHETRQDFVDAVASAIDEEVTSRGWETRVWADLDPAGRLRILYQTDSNNHAVKVRTEASRLTDGGVIAGFEDFTLAYPYRVEDASPGFIPPEVEETDPNTVYAYIPGRNSGFPVYPERVGPFYTSRGIGGGGGSPLASYPIRRLYLDFPGGLNSAIDSVKVTTTSPSGEDEEYQLVITDVSTADGWVAFEVGVGPYPWWRTTRTTNRLIVNDSHEFKAGIELAAEGSVVDAVRRLTELSPSNRNLMPFLTSNDVDVDDMETELSASSLNSLVTGRNYSLFDSEIRLEEYLAEEFKLAGMIPTINPENQKLTFRRLRFGSINEASTAEFDQSNVLTDNRLPSYVESKEHIHNITRLKTGYSFEEDEYTGPTIRVRFQQSISAFGASYFDIQPKSGDPQGDLTRNDVENVLIRPIAILGAPYAHVQFDAPFIDDAWELAPGSIIELTNIQLPDTVRGTRGIENRIGFVTGIDKNLNDGRIRIESLISLVTLAGYTPTAAIQTAVFTSNTWSLFVAETNDTYSPPGHFDYEWFSTGDAIRVEEFNSWNPANAEGIIINEEAFGGGLHQFDVSWSMDPPGSLIESKFEGARIRYQNYSGSLMTEEQKSWVFLTSGSLAGDVPSRYFGA